MSVDLTDVRIETATREDASDILAVQKLAFVSEAAIYNDNSIPPLTETVDEVLVAMSEETILKAVRNGIIVGSVRGRLLPDGTCYVGRLVVHPNIQRMGIGTKLMAAIENRFPAAKRYELFTGNLSVINIKLYERLGYRVFCEKRLLETVNLVGMEKLGGSIP